MPQANTRLSDSLPPHLMGVKPAAAAIGVSQLTLSRWIKAGHVRTEVYHLPVTVVPVSEVERLRHSPPPARGATRGAEPDPTEDWAGWCAWKAKHPDPGDR